MSVAALLVVVVTSGGGHDPVTLEAVAAANQALGASAEVRVVESAADGDEEMLAVSQREHAAVAALRWDATRSSAVVHFRAALGTRWVDRTVVFDAADAALERGRALGFTLAAMMPEALTTSAAPVVAPPVAPPPVTTPVVPRHWIGAFDASASGVLAVTDYGTALGAALGATLFLGRFGVRASGSIRAGEVSPAQATALYANAGLGVVVRIVDPHAGQRFGFGVRADAQIQYQSLSRASDDPATHQDRWVPGADLVVFATVDLAPAAAIIVGLGAETTFGVTTVYVEDSAVAQIFPLRAVGELGVLARF